VPLYCAKFIRVSDEDSHEHSENQGLFLRFEQKFNEYFQRRLAWYEGLANRAMMRPGFTAAAILGGVMLIMLALLPFLGRAYFPRTDPGQFVIDVRMPSGTRLETSNDYIARVESIVRNAVKPADLDMIVSNIGVYPDLSAIYTTNASMNTAFVQVSLKEDHSVASYEYMRRVQETLSRDMPELSTYFQAGGLVDGVVNQGLPAPIDIQVSSMDMDGAYALAKDLSQRIKVMPNVSGVYIPQDIDYPGIALNIDREKANLIGLTAKDVVQNVITAMTSDGMVAPSYWIDPKSGNNYMVTVQYANNLINNMSIQDLENIPLRGVRPAGDNTIQTSQDAAGQLRRLKSGDHTAGYTPLSSVSEVKQIATPTEVDHYQIRRVIDIYVSTKTEALQTVGGSIHKLLSGTRTDKNTVLNLRGAVVSMNRSFAEFGIGILIAILMVYLILMAQFRSFVDPFIILMAIPPGLAGVVMILLITGSTLNIVLDGRDHDDRHRRLKQHSDRRVCRAPARQGPLRSRSCRAVLQNSATSHFDDFVGHITWHDSDGARNGGRERTIRAAGAGCHWRPWGIGSRHRLSGPGSIPGYSRQA